MNPRLVAIPLLALVVLSGCGDAQPDSALLPARRGDLEMVLRLEGNLAPLNERSIKSPSWGEIRSLAPNGSQVKRGQVVLELDSERLDKSLREHQANVTVHRAELRQVEQEVEKTRRSAELHHASAKLDLALERAKFNELRARPTKRELIAAQSGVDLARELVKAGVDTATLIRELVESGYAAKDELRAADLDLVRARADLAGALASQQTVKAGASTTDRQEAAIRVQQALLSEQSAKRSIQRVNEWADSKLARFRRRVQREEEKLAEARRAMSQYRVTAPNDGMVLHAKRRWGGTWQPGRHVWQGATIMSIPDLSGMKLIVQIPADWVRKLRAEDKLTARVKTCAIPERVFDARLTKISTVGRDEFERLDPSTAGKLGRAERQVFEAEIELLGKDDRLKPGFGAEAEIVARRVTDAIIVPRLVLTARRSSRPGRTGPRQSQARAGSAGHRPASARVYVQAPAGFELRRVTVIAASRFEAAVEGDLKPGDLLYPGRPPAESIAPSAKPANGTTKSAGAR